MSVIINPSVLGGMIDTNEITDRAVTSIKVAVGGITAENLGVGAITDRHILAGANIQEAKILFGNAGHGHTGGTDGKAISGGGVSTGSVTLDSVDMGKTAGKSLKPPVVLSDQILALASANAGIGPIPSGYKWSELWIQTDTAGSNTGFYFQLNNDTGTNYAYMTGLFNGTTTTYTGSAGDTKAFIGNVGSISLSDFIYLRIGNLTFNGRKSYHMQTCIRNATLVESGGGCWLNSTAEITSILIYANGANMSAGTKILFCGIK